MKTLGYILGFISIIFKALLLVGKLLLLLPSVLLGKERSKRRFMKELSRHGVPADDAQKLTRSYMNIVNRDVLSFIKPGKNQKAD